MREPEVRLQPLSALELPLIAASMGCGADALSPMLAACDAGALNGRYYTVRVMYAGRECVGFASLLGRGDGTVSLGIDVFAGHRGQGIATVALPLLAELAAAQGYALLTAQVRTDNAASIALHKRAGFAIIRRRINRRGNEVFDMQKMLRAPVRHEMRLRPGPFAAIAGGRKRYELRLHDEKRRAIRVGDEILFTCTADDRTVLTRVTELRPFADFAALYAALPLKACGYTDENVSRADPKDMERYYPTEQQAQYGVLAIGVERVRYPLAPMAAEGLTARELTEQDVSRMLHMAQGNPLYYQYLGIHPDAQNIAQTLAALPPRRTMADKHIFGWFDGDRLCALMDLIARHPQDDVAFIGWFMVDAPMQGRGLGRRLVAQVLDVLRTEGVREVRLGRVEGNPQSRAFWQACGFTDTAAGYDTDGYHVTVMHRILA